MGTGIFRTVVLNVLCSLTYGLNLKLITSLPVLWSDSEDLAVGLDQIL